MSMQELEQSEIRPIEDSSSSYDRPHWYPSEEVLQQYVRPEDDSFPDYPVRYDNQHALYYVRVG